MSNSLRALNVAQIDLRDHVEAGTPCMLWGPGGIGKSAMVAEIARDLGIGFIDIRLSLRESVDLRGLPIPDLERGTTRWLTPDEMPRADRDGERGIILFDEINAAPMGVQVAAYQVVESGRLGEYQAPKGWARVAAGNRVSDKAGASRMSSALANRMAHIDVEADADSWADWASLNGIDATLVAFIRYRRELLFSMPDGAREYASPRSWTLASRYMAMPDKARRLRKIMQLVGQGPAIEYEGFRDIIADLQPIPYVLANPTSAQVPAFDKIAALYAVTCGVANAIDRKTARAGAAYAARLPAEFKALFAKLVVMRDKSLAAYGFADLVTGGALNV